MKEKDEDEPQDLRMKGKSVEEDDQRKPKDLKMKGKLVEEEYFYSPYPQLLSEQFKIPTVPPGFQPHSKVRERDDYVGESSKRTGQSSKRTRTRSPEVIDLTSSDTEDDSNNNNSEPLELVEGIVRVYDGYIDHIFQVARDRFEDEEKWKFDKNKCNGLAETFLHKVHRLRCELEQMKRGSTRMENYYSIVEPCIAQIMSQLEKMHERFHRSPNISASAKPNCSKQQLILCMKELNQIKKELYDMFLEVRKLKIMKMHKKAMEINYKNLRI